MYYCAMHKPSPETDWDRMRVTMQDLEYLSDADIIAEDFDIRQKIAGAWRKRRAGRSMPVPLSINPWWLERLEALQREKARRRAASQGRGAGVSA